MRRFFEICRANAWVFILTFKDGNLPSVWQEVQALRPLNPGQYRHERRIQGSRIIEQAFRWVTDIDYHGHRLQWLECREMVGPIVPGGHDERSIRKACFRELPRYRVPAQVFFTEKLPRSDRGKLLRSALRKRFGETDG